MLTFGIAGHVDHGKTSLVHALTGMQTDRLPEEQRRGISIELGFAWLDVKLADNTAQRIALVDMPGHERFVRRMIAGAAGVDAMLMVIAADEGVMPQGREHLAICQLLGIERGAVILTKTDLVDDFMLEMAREDVKELVANTFCRTRPSGRFPRGRPRGQSRYARALSSLPSRFDSNLRAMLGRNGHFACGSIAASWCRGAVPSSPGLRRLAR